MTHYLPLPATPTTLALPAPSQTTYAINWRMAVNRAIRVANASIRHVVSTPDVIYAHPPGCVVLDMATVNPRFKPGQVHQAYRILKTDQRDGMTWVQIDISTSSNPALVWRKV